MQIRRFFAKDMRSALADVSRELGPDAAILSSRQIGGGVELLAAIDYDPSVLIAPTSRTPEPELLPPAPPPTFAQPPRDRGHARVNKKPSFDELADDLIARVAELPRRAVPANDKPAPTGSVRPATRMPAAATVAPAAAESNRVHMEMPMAMPASAPQPATAGLQDLKEEVRQLRGLMQEQLQGLAWRELKQRQPLRAMLTKRLALLDLSPRLREHYAVAEGRDAEQALATALANITRDIVNGDDAMLDHGGIYAFVGATGVGKTTTIAKLAARFALRNGAGSVALISTDSYRIAGHDQLATYARLIGCAIRTADNAASLQDALDQFGDRRLILIDTAGMSQRDARLAEQLAALASCRYPIKQLLVLSATAQRAILQESVKQFGQRRVHGAILTKLDETTSLGAVLSVLLESRLPLMASCDGQRVPEDLRSLRGAQLVDRALKLAEQFRESPDEWLLAQELLANQGKATAHAGI